MGKDRLPHMGKETAKKYTAGNMGSQKRFPPNLHQPGTLSNESKIRTVREVSLHPVGDVAINKPAVYYVFPDEGHGFVRPVNRVALDAATEEFLAKYLEGRLEPPTPEESKLLASVK